jgi:hypothetical protein
LEAADFSGFFLAFPAGVFWQLKIWSWPGLLRKIHGVPFYPTALDDATRLGVAALITGILSQLGKKATARWCCC